MFKVTLTYINQPINQSVHQSIKVGKQVVDQTTNQQANLLIDQSIKLDEKTDSCTGPNNIAKQKVGDKKEVFKSFTLILYTPPPPFMFCRFNFTRRQNLITSRSKAFHKI